MNKGITITTIKQKNKVATRRSATAPHVKDKGKPVHWLAKEYHLFAVFGDKQKEAFYHELAILLQAGIDLKTALDMLIAQEQNLKNKGMLSAILASVVMGNPLSAAMLSHPVFTSYEYHSVQIGEETGKITAVLQDMAVFYKKRLKQKRQISGALTYPIIVLLTAAGAIFFMLNFIVPMFADVFQRAGGALPPITAAIVSLSDVMRQYAPYVLIGLVGIIWFLYTQRKKEWNRRWTAVLLLRLPIFGKMVRKIYLARFANAMALLTKSKIPLVSALQLCRKMVGFYPIEQSLYTVENQIMRGQSFHSSLAQFPIYDSKLISLIKVGEEVNRLADFFGKIAEQYQDDIEHQSATLSALLEPLLIIGLGLIVGFILVAMYLPMFQMGDMFG